MIVVIPKEEAFLNFRHKSYLYGEKTRVQLERINDLNDFEAIFQYSTEGILVVDETGVIVKINPNGARLFNYDAEALIGKKIEVLIPQQMKERHREHRQNYVKNPHARSMGKGLDLHGLRQDGTQFPLEISLSPYSSNGQRLVAAFIVDTTQRREMEAKEDDYRKELEREVNNRTLVLKEAIRKLETTKNELDAALTREKEVNVMKSRFISIASHEFRTPLSTALSSLNLVEKYALLKLPEKRDKHIARIKNSIKLLTDILDDILSVNKLEEGKVMVNVSEFSLGNFVTESISEITGMLRPGQQINYDRIVDFPDEIRQDKKLLRHIFMNLLTNASKFSPEGSAITVFTDFIDDEINISVKDEGIGIPEANRKQLFDRFYRADNVEQVQGTGLGLSIVAQYTHLLRGSVRFDSEQGIGSTFIVTLPKILQKSA